MTTPITDIHYSIPEKRLWPENQFYKRANFIPKPKPCFRIFFDRCGDDRLFINFIPINDEAVEMYLKYPLWRSI